MAVNGEYNSWYKGPQEGIQVKSETCQQAVENYNIQIPLLLPVPGESEIEEDHSFSIVNTENYFILPDLEVTNVSAKIKDEPRVTANSVECTSDNDSDLEVLYELDQSGNVQEDHSKTVINRSELPAIEVPPEKYIYIPLERVKHSTEDKIVLIPCCLCHEMIKTNSSQTSHTFKKRLICEECKDKGNVVKQESESDDSDCNSSIPMASDGVDEFKLVRSPKIYSKIYPKMYSYCPITGSSTNLRRKYSKKSDSEHSKTSVTSFGGNMAYPSQFVKHIESHNMEVKDDCEMCRNPFQYLDYM